MTSEMVTIPLQEYLDLREALDFLDALRSAGVDNWEGYEFALDIFHGDA